MHVCICVYRGARICTCVDEEREPVFALCGHVLRHTTSYTQICICLYKRARICTSVDEEREPMFV